MTGPVHYALLARFPVWYHVVFLGTLAPLIAVTLIDWPSTTIESPSTFTSLGKRP